MCNSLANLVKPVFPQPYHVRLFVRPWGYIEMEEKHKMFSHDRVKAFSLVDSGLGL